MLSSPRIRHFFMDEKKLYPFRLTGIDDKYGWGSERFRLADLGWRDTYVHDGWLSGSTLGDLMETYLDRLTGEQVFDAFGLQFPFQVKGIKVTGKMPLHVCPDDDTARNRYDALGKDKLWYVVSAGKGARLLLGFRRDTDASELYSECLEGNPVKLLNTLEPIPGQFFFIPAGTPHCAFGEMELIEVSQSSAMDFLLCNWRCIASDKPSETHATLGNVRGGTTSVVGSSECETVSEGLPDATGFDPALNIIDALDFIKYEQYPEALLSGSGKAEAAQSVPGLETLLRHKSFTVNRIALQQPLSIDNANSDTSIAYTSVKGAFEVQTTPDASPDGERILTAGEGETVLIPAECPSFVIAPRSSGTVLLEIMVEKLPSDDDAFDPAGNRGEDLVGDGAEFVG